MVSNLFKKLGLVIIAGALLTQTAYADLRGLPQITVLAASSLTAPLTEIIRIYSREKNITVTASYASTSDQARKITEGSSADVFISAHPAWMTDLKQRGVIDVYSLTNLVKNELVLAISKNNHLSNNPVLKEDALSQLTFLNDRMLMIMSDPEDTALGLYSKQTVKALAERQRSDLWERIKSRIIRAANSKNALYLISYGDSAGILYYTEAYKDPKLKILTKFDADLHDLIMYQAAVVAGENMTYARDFLEFLKSSEAKSIFKEHGFSVD